jgi:hypothetical protein
VTDGETALVVRVREAEPLLADLRRRFDPAERLDVPPHVTLLGWAGGRWRTRRSYALGAQALDP